jgi:hypothetical protein
MVVLQPGFVAAHLTVKFVHQLVDGRVHVLARLLDEDVLALDMQRDIGLLPTLLYPQLFD